MQKSHCRTRDGETIDATQAVTTEFRFIRHTEAPGDYDDEIVAPQAIVGCCSDQQQDNAVGRCRRFSEGWMQAESHRVAARELVHDALTTSS